LCDKPNDLDRRHVKLSERYRLRGRTHPAGKDAAAKEESDRGQQHGRGCKAAPWGYREGVLSTSPPAAPSGEGSMEAWTELLALGLSIIVAQNMARSLPLPASRSVRMQKRCRHLRDWLDSAYIELSVHGRSVVNSVMHDRSAGT
jgi:hypothetical protein